MNQALFKQALSKFNEKKFEESKLLFEKILISEPKNFRAMQALGVIHGIFKDHSSALSLFRKAISLNKDFEPVKFNLATSLFETGEYEEASMIFKELLQKNKNDPNILLNYANCLLNLGQSDEAIEYYQSSLNINPNLFLSLLNLGIVFKNKKNIEEAFKYFSRADKINNNSAIVKYHLGSIYYDRSDFKTAIAYLNHAINLKPDHLILLHCLEKKGLALFDLNDFHESKVIFEKMLTMEIDSNFKERVFANLSNAICSINDNNFELDYSEALKYANAALEINPSNIVALNNVGVCKVAMADFDEAITTLNKALQLMPNLRPTLKNLVYAYNHAGLFEKSIETIEKIESLHPEVITTDMVRAMMLFSLGRFREGWKYYEFRNDKKHGSTKDKSLPDFTKPLWTPQLGYETILIWAEQGLGDQILHGTMLTDFVKKFNKVILAVDPRLVRFFQESFPNTKVFSLFDDIEQDLFDYQIQLTSIGQYCRNSIDDFLPLKQPYSFSNNTSHNNNLDKKLKCAISWKSMGFKANDKSASLESLKKILKIQQIEFFNIQYTDVDQEVIDFQEKYNIQIKTPPNLDTQNDIYGLMKFIDTCDFVISISNTNAHLSGAVGKPTFILLNNSVGKFWYWDNFYEGKNVWYPSVKRFIQKKHKSWDEPVEELYNFLKEKYL